MSNFTFLSGNNLTADGKGDADAIERANELADSDNIVIFSKSWCP